MKRVNIQIAYSSGVIQEVSLSTRIARELKNAYENYLNYHLNPNRLGKQCTDPGHKPYHIHRVDEHNGLLIRLDKVDSIIVRG